MNFLRPAKYKNSLYGCGFFPFWIYVKVFGKPVYKMARRIGCPVYIAFLLSHTLGALSHVGFFINGINRTSLILFFLSYAIYPSILWLGHKLLKVKF